MKDKGNIILGSIVLCIVCILFVFFVTIRLCNKKNAFPIYMDETATSMDDVALRKQDSNAATEDVGKKEFEDSFDKNYVLEESGAMSESRHPNWWLNSGAYFFSANGYGYTQQGNLETGSKWQKEYDGYNPESTQHGYQPQNIFRLITRTQWADAEQRVYVRIQEIHALDAKDRDESNGVLLFHRYRDSDNLYYLGVRVDGAAVIKKKVEGVYITLAYADVFNRNGLVYDKQSAQNFLPLKQWFGLRSSVQDLADGSVSLAVYLDRKSDGHWEKILETVDTQEREGGHVLSGSGHAGIRTDFMDVAFDNYAIHTL